MDVKLRKKARKLAVIVSEIADAALEHSLERLVAYSKAEFASVRSKS
jgi:hypothetical protein